MRFSFPQTAPAGAGGPTCGRPQRARIRCQETVGCDFGVEQVGVSVGGPEERGPHRRGGRGRDEVRAWWMKKTGGTLDWLGCRAFGVEELRAEPGRQGRKEMSDNFVLKSLNYNNQTGLRASCGEGRPVAARSSPSCRNKKHVGSKNILTKGREHGFTRKREKRGRLLGLCAFSLTKPRAEPAVAMHGSNGCQFRA